MIKLKELINRIFGENYRDELVAIYKKGEPIYPDYADEILETYGDYIVKDYKIVKEILVVMLEGV